MLKEKWGNKKVITILVSCILSMLLLFCSLVGVTFSWLTHSESRPSTGTSNLATLKGDGEKTKSTSHNIQLKNSTIQVDIREQSKITNTGSIGALVRVFYNVILE